MDFLINYTGVNFHSINYHNPSEGSNETIVKRFAPGLNKITKDEWESGLKQHPAWKYLFESGIFAWYADSPDAKDSKGFNFTALSPAEAKKVIANTFTLKMLEEWGLKEKRLDILKSIKEQTDKIGPVPEAQSA